MPLIQLDFFEADEMSALKGRMEAVELSATKCRRKQFAEIGELKKICREIDERLKIIERNICKGNN